MADYLIQDSTLSGIADAIRAKTGKSAAMTPVQMPSEIDSIQTGGGGKTLTKLGEYVITAPVSYVAITATDAMKSCDWLYIKYNNVVLSASDWIYPYINGLPGSGSQTMGYDGGTTYQFTRILTALPTFSGTTKMFFFNTESVQKPRYASELNQINFRVYGSAVTFNSGSFEIWGYVG